MQKYKKLFLSILVGGIFLPTESVPKLAQATISPDGEVYNPSAGTKYSQIKVNNSDNLLVWEGESAQPQKGGIDGLIFYENIASNPIKIASRSELQRHDIQIAEYQFIAWRDNWENNKIHIFNTETLKSQEMLVEVLELSGASNYLMMVKLFGKVRTKKLFLQISTVLRLGFLANLIPAQNLK